MTFTEAKTALLENVRRPKTQVVGSAGSTIDMEDVAGRAINAALLWANRKHMFVHAEKTSEHTFTASTFTTPRASVGDGDILGLKTAQLLTASGDVMGQPLKFVTYARLQANRDAWFDRIQQGSEPTDTNTVPDLQNLNDGHERLTTQQYKYYLFQLGDAFGLYPRPTTAVTVLLHYNSKLPALSADSDTNFLLEFAWDFILSKSLKTLNVYLKEDARIKINNDQLGEEWDSVMSWDREIRSSQSLEQHGVL